MNSLVNKPISLLRSGIIASLPDFENEKLWHVTIVLGYVLISTIIAVILFRNEMISNQLDMAFITCAGFIFGLGHLQAKKGKPHRFGKIALGMLLGYGSFKQPIGLIIGSLLFAFIGPIVETIAFAKKVFGQKIKDYFV